MNYYISFQCKHMHEYNDLLLHLFADRLMDPERCGASPESNMCESLVLFMRENLEKVEKISHGFLEKDIFHWKTISITFLSLGIEVMSLHCTYCASCKAYITVLSCKFFIATLLHFHHPLRSS